MNKIFNPEIYQGDKQTNRYFEGWYFKLVTKDQKYNIAFIPGISLNQDDRHSFIQVFVTSNIYNVPTLKTYYLRFQASSFKYSTTKFEVTIGDNFFSAHSLRLKIDEPDLKLDGQIMLSKLNPIKKSLLSPSIMGFFAYIPKMECYHGVISMSHELKGSLNINKQLIDLSGGKGYLEKDWGRSFPRGYVWVQSNHFSKDNTSFMFSYADIPFLGFYFKGLICNLQIDNKEYRFATYNFAKVVEEKISRNKARYVLKRFNYRLELEANIAETTELPSPKNGKMNQTIKEGLMGEVHLKLFYKDKLIFEDHGYSSGVEIMK